MSKAVYMYGTASADDIFDVYKQQRQQMLESPLDLKFSYPRDGCCVGLVKPGLTQLFADPRTVSYDARYLCKQCMYLTQFTDTLEPPNNWIPEHREKVLGKFIIHTGLRAGRQCVLLEHSIPNKIRITKLEAPSKDNIMTYVRADPVALPGFISAIMESVAMPYRHRFILYECSGRAFTVEGLSSDKFNTIPQEQQLDIYNMTINILRALKVTSSTPIR
jgi:hypothetical protein